MKQIFLIGVFVFLLSGCSSIQYDEEITVSQGEHLNYIAFTSELIDSIGISFYDTKKIIYRADSTYIVYPEGKELIFYHFESRQITERLQFSVEVENCLAFSVEMVNNVVVYYGNAIIKMKDGMEEII